MAKEVVTLTEAREREYTSAIGTAGWGIGIVIVSLLLIVFLKYIVPPALLGASRVAAGLAALAGATMLGSAILRSLDVKKIKYVTFKCPYCDAINKLIEPPTIDFNCETCIRTIRFDKGVMVPVRQIICTNCNAEHKVAINVERFVCDQCNAVLQLQQQTQQVYMPNAPTATPKPAATLLGGHHQDVLIRALDPSRENHIAAVLQRELGVDLPEARRLLATINPKVPLIVAYDIPQLEAEALSKQLEQLGAATIMRPTQGAHV